MRLLARSMSSNPLRVERMTNPSTGAGPVFTFELVVEEFGFRRSVCWLMCVPVPGTSRYLQGCVLGFHPAAHISIVSITVPVMLPVAARTYHAEQLADLNRYRY